MRRSLPLSMLSLATLLLVPLLLAGVARGGDDDDPEALVTRFFQVGSLTLGRPDFIPGRMGIVGPDDVGDEDQPLFGSEGEEPVLPAGTADELIELLRSNVDPVSWEITEGADVATLGEDTLVVRTSRRVMPLVSKYLMELEAELLTSVTVEVRVAKGPPPRDGVITEEILAESAGSPAVMVTALVGQRAHGFAGQQLGYVQDYDVEVAKSATISDPIVGVANLGLSIAARSLLGNDPKKVRLQLDAHLADLVDIRTHLTEEAAERTRLIEMPRIDEAEIHTDLLLDPGVWTLAEGDTAHARYFIVRATPWRRTAVPPRAPTEFGPPVPADSGPLVTRTFDVTDLEMWVPNSVGSEINLLPSNFTPPEPPELPEPESIFPSESIAELLPALVMPKSWNRQGASIDVRMGRLMITNTEKALKAVGVAIRDLRRVFLWTIRTRAEIVELPQVLAQLLASPGANGYLLDERRLGLLADALASGDARRLDAMEVASLGNTRNAVRAGRTVSYLQDFEVELSEDAVIANPVVLHALSGAVLDLAPSLVSTGDAASIAVQFTRGVISDPIREVITPHGPIEAPEMELLRLRTNLQVPFGRTAVVGAGSRDGQVILLLLTPTLERYED